MLKFILTIAILTVSSSVAAKSIDWTPYLKWMQDSCNFNNSNNIKDKLDEGKIPKALKPSVVKRTRNTNKTRVQLKNAIAFGQPINRIEIEHPETSYSAFTVYFANNNFTKIKPNFFLRFDNKQYAVGSDKAWGVITKESEKIDKHGYPIRDETYVLLSKQEREKFRKSQEPYHSISNFDGLVYVDSTGWFKDDNYQGEQESLFFEHKTRSVTCSYGM